MTKFVAIKVHYDHRKSLPSYLKYSKVPSPEEYQEYLDLYREEGIGGEGFHECLNFSVHDGRPAKIYLPPTCIPNDKYANEEMVFFSFTYKYDKELPSHIVGVHAGARLMSVGRKAIERYDIDPIEGADRFHYHAEAPSDLTTLITPPIEYDFRDGVYTRKYSTWGFGLRYITEEHAANIIRKGLAGANDRLINSKGSEALVLQREIDVLEAIRERYALPSVSRKYVGIASSRQERGSGSVPDQELGYLGEKFVYEAEVAYAERNGIPASEVQWVSQTVPQSPYDIKTVRVTKGAKRDHYIEVKSSRVADESNIYVSSGQIHFFKENEYCSTFKLVSFSSRSEVRSVRELDIRQLLGEFELVPVKYKLRRF